jgi:NAD-dependent deacetylase
LAERIFRGAPIVILTGAGISKESGLHTFRDPDGLWATVRIEDVATPEAFQRDPRRVQAFYNARRRSLVDPAIQPNAAHHALARLDAEWPGDLLLVTQNIDDLHDRAGSRRMIHMHGEMLKARCLGCGGVVAWRDDIAPDSVCPACDGAGRLRPHVVWFGEMPIAMDAVYGALARAAVFVSIGTSGNVYPAAGFVAEAKQAAGAHAIELNLEPSLGASLFDESIYGPATSVVPAFVDRLLAER